MLFHIPHPILQRILHLNEHNMIQAQDNKVQGKKMQQYKRVWTKRFDPYIYLIHILMITITMA